MGQLHHTRGALSRHRDHAGGAPLSRPHGALSSFARAGAAAAVVAGSAAALLGVSGAGATAHAASAVQRGGVYRTAVSSFGFTDNLDPVGETQVGNAYAIYDATLRTLVGYKHLDGAAGEQLVPDLATSLPSPTDNGLTYTFHLKPDIKWGPPVDREITSYDVAYAFTRMNDVNLAAEYPYYYIGVIKGFTGAAKSLDNTISGITTPNATTIVFHLVKPTGDFLKRIAMPAAAPVPPEVAKCFTTAGTYGRDLISSGPYMIQGESKLDISSCSTIKPLPGYDPTTHLTLVRNPNYVQSTDTTRANYLNGIEIGIDPNVSDIFAKVQRGELDGSYDDPPSATVTRQYLINASQRQYFHSDPINQVEAITMNLDVPPFTDVHVRKAVAWVLDKSEMLTDLGGTSHYDIATHIITPTLPGGLPASYDPYATPNEQGSLAKAQAEMRLSAFDPSHDGKCDVSVCKNLAFVNISQFSGVDTVVQQDLAEIGIDIVPRDLSVTTAFDSLFTVKDREPMSALGGGYADYTGTYSFAEPNFGSAAVAGPVGCCNYSNVGLTKADAAADHVPYPATGIPSVDPEINRCEALYGSAQNTCWENFDKYMMTVVMAWAPYVWGRNIVVTAPDVTRYVMDQASSSISLTQLAVDNNITVADQ